MPSKSAHPPVVRTSTLPALSSVRAAGATAAAHTDQAASRAQYVDSSLSFVHALRSTSLCGTLARFSLGISLCAHKALYTAYEYEFVEWCKVCRPGVCGCVGG